MMMPLPFPVVWIDVWPVKGFTLCALIVTLTTEGVSFWATASAASIVPLGWIVIDAAVDCLPLPDEEMVDVLEVVRVFDLLMPKAKTSPPATMMPPSNDPITAAVTTAALDQ